MSLHYLAKNIRLAKRLRSNATPQEKRLWYDFLASYPIRFQRQKAIDGFIADFYCHKAKLVIEVDGLQHSTPTGRFEDSIRTYALEAYDLCVIRFRNDQVDHHFVDVCAYIDKVVRQRMDTFLTE